MIEQVFLKFSTEKLDQFRDRIHDCVNRLTDDQIWLRHTENENSVGNLVLHLCGNVRQWILHGVAGQPDIRRRDSEFAARGGFDKAALLGRLDETIDAAIGAIKALPPERLLEETNLQQYHLTLFEAIAHVVEHFAQHTAQIIFATKLLTGTDLAYYKHLSQPRHKETTP